MPAHDARGHQIVVGVDGSAASLAALRWSVRQAGLTGATVQVVVAWHVPPMASGYGWGPVAALPPMDLAEQAEKVAADAIARAVDPASDVAVTTTIGEGPAARVLLDAAADAELLVIGSRGHGEFASALLGSVSSHCAHHARCPVLIVHDPAGPRG